MSFKKSLLTIEDPNNLHLCFELDDKTYAINAKNVLEVTSLPLINEPQKLPECIVGILNYNDLFINVFDIRKVFNLPQKKYELSNNVIVVKGEESLFAMIVDKVSEFFTATPANVQRVMGENFNSIVRTFYKINENIINIIDVEKLEDAVKKVHLEKNTTNYADLFPNDEESLCIMQKRSKEIAKSPVLTLDADFYGRNQYIIFTINEHKYCIYSLFVKELITLKNYPITRIPFTPDFIEGIVNLKGNFYTVIDLKKFIDLDSDVNKGLNSESKIIVIESTELKIAFLADEINDIINISPEVITNKNDMNLDKLYIQAEAYVDDEVYNILNIDKLINDERLYVDNTSQ